MFGDLPENEVQVSLGLNSEERVCQPMLGANSWVRGHFEPAFRVNHRQKSSVEALFVWGGGGFVHKRSQEAKPRVVGPMKVLL